MTTTALWERIRESLSRLDEQPGIPDGSGIGLGVGFAAGLSVAIGGAIKDAPSEGFNLLMFVRSPLIGALVGWVVATQMKIVEPAPLFLATIGGERIVVGGYKLLTQMPNKFALADRSGSKQLVSGNA